MGSLLKQILNVAPEILVSGAFAFNIHLDISKAEQLHPSHKIRMIDKIGLPVFAFTAGIMYPPVAMGGILLHAYSNIVGKHVLECTEEKVVGKDEILGCHFTYPFHGGIVTVKNYNAKTNDTTSDKSEQTPPSDSNEQ
jgi:hypothetical protein